MSAIEVLDDLIELERLAEQERDAVRRRRLVGLQERVAARAPGAKVSEAARALGLSQPTVRAWVEAGVLDAVPDRRPARVTLASLAAAKRAVDELRSQRRGGEQLLVDVLRLLRDRAVLAGADAAAGFDDLVAGRTTRLDAERLDELLPPARGTSPSTSS